MVCARCYCYYIILEPSFPLQREPSDDDCLPPVSSRIPSHSLHIERFRPHTLTKLASIQIVYFMTNINHGMTLSNQAVVVLSGVAAFSSSKINFSFSCLISGITFSVIMLSKFFSSTSNAISI